MTCHPTLFWLLLFWGVLPTLLSAQVDSIPTLEEGINPDLIEDYIFGGDGEEAFDFDVLYEDLAYYRAHPIDINKATKEELESLRLLNDLQINDFLQYRLRCGDFIALQELQAIPSFSLDVIYQLLPFIAINRGLDDFKIPLGRMLYQGDNELFLRWSRVLEPTVGSLREPTQGKAYFLGDPNKYYLRFRHRYSNKLSFGLTAEKDAGEEFFKGSNAQGFDYYSAHLFLNNYNQWLKSVAIGDFTASFGQGLILFSGFGSRKGSQVMNIKRSRSTLSPYRSADENNFLRGAGITVLLKKHLELTAFASSRQRDANIIVLDTIEFPDEIDTPDLISASSLQITGLHRTAAEIEDEKDVQQQSFGGSIKYKTNRWHLALNGLYETIDRPLTPTSRPYNQFYFQGSNLFNSSLDYSYIFRNINVFGEFARSDNGAWASTNGLLLGLDRHLDIAVLYRNFGRDYQALTPNPLAESQGARNEVGLYLGMEYRLNSHWKLVGYYDLYRHPWLRFQVDAPSHGVEYRLRLTYFQKRKLETYMELRNEIKQINAPERAGLSNSLTERQLLQIRLHLSQTINKNLQLKSRIDFGFFQKEGFDKLKGFMAYQDIIWKFTQRPINISTRLAIFDTDGYDIRFYNYENDLLNNFSIPAYYNRGMRFYFNLRYTGIRRLSVEGRFARTYWTEDFFGSGLDLISGNKRSEVKCQISYRF